MLQRIYTQLGKVPRWTGADGYGLETQGKKVSLLDQLSLQHIYTVRVGSPIVLELVVSIE